MLSMNRVQLIGNLGADPEVRRAEGKQLFVKLSLASSKVYNNSAGERIKDTQWHSCVLFRRQAEIAAQYLKKGRQILVEGELRYVKWTDERGSVHKTAQIVVHQFQFIDKAPERTAAAAEGSSEDDALMALDPGDDPGDAEQAETPAPKAPTKAKSRGRNKEPAISKPATVDGDDDDILF